EPPDGIWLSDEWQRSRRKGPQQEQTGGLAAAQCAFRRGTPEPLEPAPARVSRPLTTVPGNSLALGIAGRSKGAFGMVSSSPKK
ncbi:unnamed protein product, partial [Symbiodinium sp. CCMP2456]